MSGFNQSQLDRMAVPHSASRNAMLSGRFNSYSDPRIAGVRVDYMLIVRRRGVVEKVWRHYCVARSTDTHSKQI